MHENIKISIIQSDIIWTDIDKNLAHFTNLVSKIKDSKFIFLPEMFNTGFCPNLTNFAETMNCKTVNWMKNISLEKKCVVAGTLMIKEDKKIFNRLVWVSASGNIITYDKWHLFSLAEEDKFISKGIQRIIINEFGWKFCPLICYDLRFPVFSRNKDDYDILIYLANWPAKRILAWNTLLKARAIENQCYVIGVNRVGYDSNRTFFNGYSKVIDLDGRELISASENTDEILNIKLSICDLRSKRKKMNFLEDRDDFILL